jgi:uncharacterized protein (DUF2345 family)
LTILREARDQLVESLVQEYCTVFKYFWGYNHRQDGFAEQHASAMEAKLLSASRTGIGASSASTITWLANSEVESEAPFHWRVGFSARAALLTVVLL